MSTLTRWSAVYAADPPTRVTLGFPIVVETFDITVSVNADMTRWTYTINIPNGGLTDTGFGFNAHVGIFAVYLSLPTPYLTLEAPPTWAVSPRDCGGFSYCRSVIVSPVTYLSNLGNLTGLYSGSGSFTITTCPTTTTSIPISVWTGSVELDDSFNSIVGYIGEGYYAYMIDAEGAHVNPQIAGPAATVPCTGPLVVTAVSDPPTWVHIGTPPVPIGPSLAFSEQVTNVFDIADTVWNSGGSQSANATVRYVLSRNGKAQDFTIGTRSVLPLAPGQSNSGVTRVSVGSNVTAGFYYVLACVETKCKTSSDVGLVVDFASAIKDSVGPTITVLDANGVGIRTSFVVGIRTSFVPKFLLTPKQAAELGGYDHFNWLNLAVDDPLYDNEFFRFAAHLPVGPLAGSFTEDGTIPRAPYVDPPAGGWLYQVWNCRSLGVTGFPIQDHYAWYFDEVFDDCRVQTDKGKTDIAFRTSDDEVKFVDYPRSFIGYPVTFNTYLERVAKLL